MSKQQTAVEYLMDKLYDPSYDIKKQIKWFEEAKKMEEEQIRKAFIDSEFVRNLTDEQYYNETFKS